MKVKINPIIGYHIVDKNYCVMGPPGSTLDPAFASEARARQSARRYGREKEVHEVGALHLAGVLSVVFHDVGDIHLDGQSAQRLVEACQRNGIEVNLETVRRIDVEEKETKYSCRQILTH